VIFHDYYANMPRAEIDRFVEGQELCRLVTLGPDGTPHLGLYPFVYDGGTLDLHLVRVDEQVQDLTSQPRCLEEFIEILSEISSI